MNLNDTRVRRTRQAIRENFLALLRQKPVGRITVKEICDLCQINRTTFYKHYRDPMDVLEKLEEEMLAYLRRSLQSPMKDVAGYLDHVLANMEEHGDIYLTLASEHGDPALPAKVIQCSYQAVFPRFEQSHPEMTPAQRDMAYQFLVHGSGGVLAAWLRSGFAEPRENVVALLLRMSRTWE